MLEDSVLIWRFKGGSREAWQRVCEKYRTDLIRPAAMLLHDAGAAEGGARRFLWGAGACTIEGHSSRRGGGASEVHGASR
jgi:hypothetical protein